MGFFSLTVFKIRVTELIILKSRNLYFLGRMFAVGISQGPPHHYWYLMLDRFLPKRDLRTVMLKILADQIFAAPFFAITFFFGMGVLEDKRMSECWNEFKKKFPTVYLVNMLVPCYA